MGRRGFTGVMASILAGVVLLTGCTSADDPGPAVSSDQAAPESIEFTVAAEPLMSTEPDARFRNVDAVVLGDRLIVGGATGPITAYPIDDETPAWDLKPFGGAVGAGRTRALPLRTSPAAGGIVLAAYTEECFWEHAPCVGAPTGTESILGVAAVAADDGRVVWRAELWSSGPKGSATEDDGIYLEPEVVAADDTGVLVTLSTNRGVATPSGTPGMTTVLLDASTGKERWRVDGFRGGFLTDRAVLGVSGDDISASDPHPDRINALLDRRSGTALGVQLSPFSWVQYAGGPGALVDDRIAKPDLDTRNIRLIDGDGNRVSSGADNQNLAQATCPAQPIPGLLACAVTARSHDAVLVTWARDEATPTTAPAPLSGHQQLWAVSGSSLLITENGYQNGTDEKVASWFPAKRDGTVIGTRHPGAAIAASEDYLVVRTVNAKGEATLSTFRITTHP